MLPPCFRCKQLISRKKINKYGALPHQWHPAVGMLSRSKGACSEKQTNKQTRVSSAGTSIKPPAQVTATSSCVGLLLISVGVQKTSLQGNDLRALVSCLPKDDTHRQAQNKCAASRSTANEVVKVASYYARDSWCRNNGRKKNRRISVSFHFRNMCRGLKMFLCEGVRANSSNDTGQEQKYASILWWMNGWARKGSGCGGAEQYTEAVKHREKPCQNSCIVEDQFPSQQICSELTWQRWAALLSAALSP